MPDRRTIKLLVISDLICPWCYIGQREMEKAIEACSDLPIDIEIEWRPYKIYPSLKDGTFVPKREWYESRFSKDKVEQMEQMSTVRGEQLGIKVKILDGVISQTTLAHRLLSKAWKLGGQVKQQALLSRIFKAYFETSENIGDTQVLAKAAVDADVMTHDEAVKFLESDELLEEVETMMTDARRKGVNGVPFVVIDGKWAVSGGQTAEVYAQIFKKLAAGDTTARRPRVEPPSAGVQVSA